MQLRHEPLLGVLPGCSGRVADGKAAHNAGSGTVKIEEGDATRDEQRPRL